MANGGHALKFTLDLLQLLALCRIRCSVVRVRPDALSGNNKGCTNATRDPSGRLFGSVGGCSDSDPPRLRVWALLVDSEAGGVDEAGVVDVG